MFHIFNDKLFSTVLIFMLFAAVSSTSPKINPIFQLVSAIPAAVMESNMACKVFRAMILRSLDVDQAEPHSTLSRGIELDTSLELRARTIDIELV